MSQLLKVNLQAHFAYYRRSRLLLLAFGVLFPLLTALFSLPLAFMTSRLETFAAMREIFTTLNELLIPFSAGLTLFIISSHLRARNLKMVFTKPCPPAVWLASAFLSAALVSLFLNALILLAALVMSVIARAPVRAGLLFVSLDTFAACLGMMAYLMFLAMIAHPVSAAAFAIIFNPELFYTLQLAMQRIVNGNAKSVAARAFKGIFHWLYMTLPMVHPCSRQTASIYGTLRVNGGEWHYLGYALGYAVALSALFYASSLFFLQRKRLI